MSFTVVRYRPGPDRADENQDLVEKVFAELAETRPRGLRYMTFRLDDGTFVHVADLAADVDAEANPLFESQAFARFQEGIGERCAGGEPPNPQPATVVGRYGFDV
ncbi:MAG: hypothetical protein AAGA93_00110 [Actinomycetota bacterium]